MPRLIAALLRHGEYRQLPDTPSALQPFPLTDEGRQQARHAAGALMQMALDMGCRIDSELHSSRLLRGCETASILGEALKGDFAIQGFDALAERSVGSAANLTVSQIEAVVREDPRFEELPPDWKSSSHFCLPLQGAESLVEAGQRVAQHLVETMRQLACDVQQDTLKVFVGHGAAMRHAAWHLGVLELADVARLSMFHAQPVCLEYSDAGWKHVGGDWKVRDAMAQPD